MRAERGMPGTPFTTLQAPQRLGAMLSTRSTASGRRLLCGTMMAQPRSPLTATHPVPSQSCSKTPRYSTLCPSLTPFKASYEHLFASLKVHKDMIWLLMG